MGGDDSLSLGKSLQAARQHAGMTQQQLCDQAGLSYSTLAKIERGAIKTPSVFTVAQIARVLQVSMDDLLGVVVDGQQKLSDGEKKTSKNGVKFLYLDINGCLVRFFHAAFTQLSADSGVPSDVIESVFWHYNDAVCRGEMSLDEFNRELERQLNFTPIDWAAYYLDAVQPITEMRELVQWASKHYRIGLLSNIMPGLIEQMLARELLPNVAYDVIADSSVLGLIKPEQELYFRACELAGVAPAEILFVDDSRTNLMAAEHQGWRVMWFDDYDPAQSVTRIKSALEF